jgi:hypothetical protein
LPELRLEGGSSSTALPWAIIVRGSLGKGEILKPLGLVRISVGINDKAKKAARTISFFEAFGCSFRTAFRSFLGLRPGVASRVSV